LDQFAQYIRKKYQPEKLRRELQERRIQAQKLEELILEGALHRQKRAEEDAKEREERYQANKKKLEEKARKREERYQANKKKREEEAREREERYQADKKKLEEESRERRERYQADKKKLDEEIAATIERLELLIKTSEIQVSEEITEEVTELEQPIQIREVQIVEERPGEVVVKIKEPTNGVEAVETKEVKEPLKEVNRTEPEDSMDGGDEEEEEEDKLQRRLWESNIELGQLIPISGTPTVAEIINEVVGTDESAVSMQGNDDATMEADSCTSVDPAVKVNDVILVSNEITLATSYEVPLYQCISFPTITLAAITLSDELRLLLWSSEVRLKLNSPQRDVCARRKDSRFLMPIQQSTAFSSSSGKQTCNLQPRVQMQTVAVLIGRVLTTCELGARDNQSDKCSEATRNHSVRETKREKREIVAVQTTDRKEMKFQFETDAARTTATSSSRINFNNYKSRHKAEVNYKSRHKAEVKSHRSRHKVKVKKLREQYHTVSELQVSLRKTKCVQLGSAMLTLSLLAEYETHCVGPG
jgi:hypothetical protein